MRTFKLNNLCFIKRILAIDETTIFKISPIGFMIPTGVPDKAKIAIYAEAPPWPTDEYKTEPINNKKAVNELAIKYSIIKFPFK
jgi:hypothetical protein